MKNIAVLFLLFFLFAHIVQADIEIRQVFFLSQRQITQFRAAIHRPENSYLLEQIKAEVDSIKDITPQALEKMYYEGLLDTDPRRMATESALEDMNKVAAWLYHYYVFQDKESLEQIKKYLLAWSQTYIPTSNPINENKLEPLWISYAVLAQEFNQAETKQIENWILASGQKVHQNNKVPRNNWLAKKIKIAGTIGLVLNNRLLTDYAVQASKAYVKESLYPDGSSQDLKQRDALSYHVSGLDPLLALDIHLKLFDYPMDGNLFFYESETGSSIQKSVDFLIPFATGEQKHAEFAHTTVQLDKKRAEAGIPGYQPGTIFNPKKALSTMELASYYGKKYNDTYLQLANNKKSINKLIIELITWGNK